MQFRWHKYKNEDASLVDLWLDDYAVNETGLDDGWQSFYDYWQEENPKYGATGFCLIAEENNVPFAVIYIGVLKKEAVISEYIVSPDMRGKGYGTAALKDIIVNSNELLGTNIDVIQAVIYPSNIASQRAFEKAGFIKTSTHPDCDAFDYEYRTSINIVDGKNYIAEVRSLIIEYAESLGRNLSFQDIEEELKNPAKKYTFPEGEMLVALNGEQVAGMVAYHRHSSVRCEMKRLYIKPEYRCRKLGEKLVREIIEHAKNAGYTEMVLDTIEPLKPAIHLYEKYGFKECEPYYNNPMSDVIYMKKELK